jgi:WD40 repeat protein
MTPLRIYLSSTFEDLKQYRAAVFDALEKAGLRVARMEGYVALDERPVDLCLKDVAQSDIYVGLFAWRYGYVPPAEHGNPDGCSITELEYRLAAKDQKCRLIFFADPSTEEGWPARFRDDKTREGDCGARIKAFKRELGIERTTSFFTTPHHLASLVLAAILRQEAIKRPFIVPQLPEGVVSRPEKASRLREALLADDQATPVAVEGGGGFGKTTLAKQACHDPEVIKAFSDGILWTTLGQHPNLSGELTTIYAALTSSRPNFAGIDDAKRSIAEKLKGHRHLLVVDDVWRTSDLKIFQELGAARVLYTTRRRDLDLRTAQIEVEEMTPEQSVELLIHDLPVTENLRPTFIKFADELGSWPLLLSLTNARLRRELKERNSLEKAVDRVHEVFLRRGVTGFDKRDAEKRDEAIRLSLEAGLEAFDPRFRERAVTIGLFPEDTLLPVDVLAALWGCDSFEAEEDVLEPLHNLRIISWDRSAGVVSSHDVVRAALALQVNDVRSQHTKLLEAWGDPYQLRSDYAWRYYSYHLRGTTRLDDLRRLLLDSAWIRAKLNATDIHSLLSDFDALESLEGEIQLLRDALRLSAHVLTSNKSELSTQLLAHLPLTEKALRDGIIAGMEHARLSWFRPNGISLASAGSPLIRTLRAEPPALIASTALGIHLLSLSPDSTLNVWNTGTGKCIRTLEVKILDGCSFLLSPDQRRIVAISKDGSYNVLDFETGQCIRTLTGNNGSTICYAAFGRDSEKLVSLSDDGILRVWELETVSCVQTLKSSSPQIMTVGFTPDGTKLLTGQADFAFTPDSERLITASYNHRLELWDLEIEQLINTVWFDADSFYDESDGQSIQVKDRWAVPVWDVQSFRTVSADETVEPLMFLEGHTRRVNLLVLSTDAKKLITGSWDKTIRVWDLQSGECLRTLEGHSNRISALQMTPDQRHPRIAGSVDKTLKLWDLATGQCVTTFYGHGGSVDTIALASSGKQVVSASEDATVKVWDLNKRSPDLQRNAHPTRVSTLAVTPDGKKVISGSSWGDLKAWDFESHECLYTLQAHSDEINAIVVTPDSKTIVTGSSDKLLKVWDRESGECRASLVGHDGDIHAIAVSSDGKQIVSGSQDGTLRVWTLENAEGISVLERHGLGVSSVSISSDNRWIVSASKDGTLRIWDFNTGRCIATLKGHNDIAVAMLASGGRKIISRSTDNLVKIWDAETGSCLNTLQTYGWPLPFEVMFTAPTSNHIVALSADSTAKVWNAESGQFMYSVSFAHSPKSLYHFAFLVRGKPIVFGFDGGSRVETIVAWDLKLGSPLASFTPDAEITACVISQDSSRIVIGNRGGFIHCLSLENVE